MNDIVDDATTAANAGVAKVMSWLQHGAAWLIGASKIAGVDVQKLEAASPLVNEALTTAKALAEAHDLPVTGVETALDDILNIARAIDAGVKVTPANAPPPPVETTGSVDTGGVVAQQTQGSVETQGSIS